jgi:hypothetical protein
MTARLVRAKRRFRLNGVDTSRAESMALFLAVNTGHGTWREVKTPGDWGLIG